MTPLLEQMKETYRLRATRVGGVEWSVGIEPGLPFGASVRIDADMQRPLQVLHIRYRIGSALAATGSRTEHAIVRVDDVTPAQLWRHMQDRVLSMSRQWADEMPEWFVQPELAL